MTTYDFNQTMDLPYNPTYTIDMINNGIKKVRKHYNLKDSFVIDDLEKYIEKIHNQETNELICEILDSDALKNKLLEVNGIDYNSINSKDLKVHKPLKGISFEDKYHNHLFLVRELLEDYDYSSLTEDNFNEFLYKLRLKEDSLEYILNWWNISAKEENSKLYKARLRGKMVEDYEFWSIGDGEPMVLSSFKEIKSQLVHISDRFNSPSRLKFFLELLK